MRSVTEQRGFGTTLLYMAALLALVLATCGACAAGEAEPRVATASAPEGMVRVPGGSVRIGSDDGSADERPTFTARVRPFFLDRHPVTVAQFRRFVEATGYVTEAERFGDAGVMDHETGRWTLVAGASWRRPLGPSAPAAPDDHPVTQLSWNDAAAYARWLGRRLPTEIEWEHAARGGTDSRAPYPWGDRLVVEGRHMANTGERATPRDTTLMDAPRGVAHQHPSDEDGWLGTSPVGTYGETPLGLVDMGGNVWEWTDSWYRSYAERDEPFVAHEGSERVQRGGSFLCSTDFCHGFRVSARSHATPETALFHVGFRTAADAP
jgi:sulfatase modifying factor 1